MTRPSGPDDPATFSATTATFVVVSSMVGVGILTTSGYTAIALGSHAATLGLWAVGGLIALCGALTFAELSAALPRSGGEYVFLREAFGPAAGFLAGWASFLLGFAAPIAAVASAAMAYLLEPLGADESTRRVAAAAAIAGFAAVQGFSRTATGGLQAAVSLATLLGLGLFAAVGLTSPEGRWGHLDDLPAWTPGTPAAALRGLVFVSYAYTGWNGASYIAGEVADPGRRLPPAMLIGTGLVIGLYLALNLAYARALSVGDLKALAAESGPDAVQPIAALAAGRLLGERTASAVSAGFGVVLLASLGALMLSGSRVIAAMAAEGQFPRPAARTFGRGRTPAVATAILATSALILLFSGSFRSLVVFASVGLAIFSTAAVATVFVLRRTQPDLPRPFRVPGYPLVPAVFVAANGLLVAAALADPEEGPPARLSVVALAAGLPLYWALNALRGRRSRGGGP